MYIQGLSINLLYSFMLLFQIQNIIGQSYDSWINEFFLDSLDECAQVLYFEISKDKRVFFVLVLTLLNHVYGLFAAFRCEAQVDVLIDVDSNLDHEALGPRQIDFQLVNHEYSIFLCVIQELLDP